MLCEENILHEKKRIFDLQTSYCSNTKDLTLKKKKKRKLGIIL